MEECLYDNDNDTFFQNQPYKSTTSTKEKISVYLHNNFIQLFLISDNKAASREFIIHSILLFDSSTSF